MLRSLGPRRRKRPRIGPTRSSGCQRAEQLRVVPGVIRGLTRFVVDNPRPPAVRQQIGNSVLHGFGQPRAPRHLLSPPSDGIERLRELDLSLWQSIDVDRCARLKQPLELFPAHIRERRSPPPSLTVLEESVDENPPPCPKMNALFGASNRVRTGGRALLVTRERCPKQWGSRSNELVFFSHAPRRTCTP
jgi:hypothetical protein